MAAFQLEKTATRSNAGSTAGDGWLWFPFDPSFSLGSQYKVESIYVKFEGVKSASGAFTGDVPVRIETNEGTFSLGDLEEKYFPDSSDTKGTTITGYLWPSDSVYTRLASMTIKRIDLGQSTYNGGKDIRCLASASCTLTLKYNYAFTRCRAPSSVNIEKSVTALATNTLSWEGASAGTNNAISGYFIQYADSSDNKTWGAWTELKTVGVVNSAEVAMPAENKYRKYKVWTLGAAGSDWRSEAGTESVATYRGHAALEGFTDSPLIAGQTYVKALHMQELQARANTLRGFYALSAYNFTTITSGVTGIKDWTKHVNEIRAAIDEISTKHDAWLEIPVNRPRADVIEQLRAVILAM